jgi:DnaK suppressor protein
MITADQMFEFEDKIDALIRQLQQEIADAAESTAAVAPDNAIGRISRMDSMLAQEVAKAAVALKQKRILDLTAARLRLDEGRFGWCAECLKDIELERLEMAPETVFCAKCSVRKKS